MANDDHLYLVTDLSKEEVLKLFMRGTEPFPEIGNVPRPNPEFSMIYVETECYSIECEKCSIDYAKEFHYSDFGIIPTMEFYIVYKDHHRTEGENDIGLKTIQLVNEITGDMAFSYKDRIALKRIDGKLKLVKDLWPPALLALIKQDYELVDAPNVD
jgi:hypothetical protein